MKNIAIIPARSGSKGLRDKNIKMLGEQPLLVFSIKAAEKSEMFEKIMVSTDSEIYADISIKYGAEVPFLRDESLSGDKVGSWDVVCDVLTKYYSLGEKFDSVCLLQPTSPLRTFNDIVGGYKLYEEKDADAITAVCEVDHSPLWCMTLPKDGSLNEFKKKVGKGKTRQELKKYYRINGALYIRKIQYLNEKILLKSEKEYAYIMDRSHSVDIDTEDDFNYAEYMLMRTTRR